MEWTVPRIKPLTFLEDKLHESKGLGSAKRTALASTAWSIIVSPKRALTPTSSVASTPFTQFLTFTWNANAVLQNFGSNFAD
jgi:hypothetical protein